MCPVGHGREGRSYVAQTVSRSGAESGDVEEGGQRAVKRATTLRGNRAAGRGA